MDTCKNCGKPLENPDQELCPACRAVENAKARTRREEKAGHARRRRMNRTTRKMLIAVCVLAVVFTGLCVTATVMYDKYNPDEFIASVDAALEAGDARALKNLLKGEDLTVSDEGAAALCRAFTDAAQREAAARTAGGPGGRRRRTGGVLRAGRGKGIGVLRLQPLFSHRAQRAAAAQLPGAEPASFAGRRAPHRRTDGRTEFCIRTCSPACTPAR